jgi:hypothetical protein
MGRPLRCIQQPSPFISFSNILNTSTSTTSAPFTTSDPISQYINIPISGYPCPSNFSVTTSTTSTTLPPLVITNNINNCTLYSFIFESQEIELDFDCVFPTPNSNSAIVRYQPCQSGVFVNELIYNSKDLCVAGTVGNNIRILSGNGNLAKIGSCNNNITTSTTISPTTTTSTTTNSPQILMPSIGLIAYQDSQFSNVIIQLQAFGADGNPNTLDSIPELQNAGYINQLRTTFEVDLEYRILDPLIPNAPWSILEYFEGEFYINQLNPYGFGGFFVEHIKFNDSTFYEIRGRLRAIDSVGNGPWAIFNFSKL